ncbi:hypothetical protein LXL04_039469 [Taraxacum kok-saghyz]
MEIFTKCWDIASVVCKGFYPPLDGNYTSWQPVRLIRRTGLANDTCLWGPRPLLLVGKQAAGTRVASSPDSDLEAFSHNPAHGSFAPLAFQPSAMTNSHVPYWWVNNPTLGEFCFTMIGRADIEGSKSNVAMNAWLPQASYPCEKITLPEAPADVSGLPNFGTVTRLPVHPASPVLLTKNGPLGALDSVARLNKAAAPSYLFKSDERFARQYRCGPPPEFPLASPRSGIVHHLSVHPARGIPPISFLVPCGFTHPLTRTHVRLLGPCFKTGRMGCPQAGAGSAQPRLWPPHQSAPVHAPSRSADRLTPFHIRPGRIAGPHSLPSRQFQALFDSLFKVLFIFPSRYLFAIGLTPVFSLGRNLPPYWGCIPKQPDSQTAPRGATGSGHDGALTLSGAPFQGTWARSAAEDASPDYNSDSKAARFSSWADPGFDNDPSAGSPTETLLRLLLPLNDKVQWNSRDVAGGEPPTLRSRSLTELTRQIAPPTKNGHAPPPIESRKSSQSVNPYYVWTWINQVAFLLDTAHHEAASRHMENGHVEKHNTKQGQKPQSLKTMCPYYVPYPRYQAAIH